jgi:hypothetical protein
MLLNKITRHPYEQIMAFNKKGISIGADYAVSKNKTDDEIGLYTVTLSRSEGSVALGVEMLRCGSA